MSEASGPTSEPKKKRSRLSCACVRCRKKKIKCDEALPSCTNCTVAGAECVVTKPSENSHVAPVRQKTGLGPAALTAQPGVPGSILSRQPVASTSAIPYADSAAPDRSSFLNTMHLVHAQQGNAHQLPRASQVEYAQPQRVTFAPSPSQHTASPGTSKGAGMTPDTDQSTPYARLADPGLLHDVDSVKRKFIGASSSQIFLKWLDTESRGAPLTPYLRHGVSSSDEFGYSVDESLIKPLPPPEEVTVYLDRYFQTSHVMYPCIDEAEMREIASNPEALKKDPILRVVLYLVICIGNDVGMTPQISFSQDGSRYLEAAWAFLPLVMSRPFKSSVQALCLLSIALRNRNNDGNAYVHCGTAIRVAQSLGMHLSQPSETPDLDARIFWTCYCLDKTLAFETGRPSALNDIECATPLPTLTPDALLHRPGYPVLNPFMAFVGICQELSLISARLFSKMATTMTPVEALQWIGECDARLTRWADSLPLDLQPGIDGAADSGILPFTARISTPYYLALITLHRLSLFDESTLIQPYLSEPSLRPYLARLRSSGSICAQAARATLTTFERLANKFPADRMWTVHAVTSAIFVLALRIWKNPTSMSSRADLQFIRSASDFTVQKYRELGYNESFITLLPKLLAKVQYKVDNPTLPSRPSSRQNSPAPGEDTGKASTPGPTRATSEGTDALASLPINEMFGNSLASMMHVPSVSTSTNGQSVAPAGTTDFAPMWPMLLGDGDGFDALFNSYLPPSNGAITNMPQTQRHGEQLNGFTPAAAEGASPNFTF